jgi:hypothetical protein
MRTHIQYPGSSPGASLAVASAFFLLFVLPSRVAFIARELSCGRGTCADSKKDCTSVERPRASFADAMLFSSVDIGLVSGGTCFSSVL